MVSLLASILGFECGLVDCWSHDDDPFSAVNDDRTLCFRHISGTSGPVQSSLTGMLDSLCDGSQISRQIVRGMIYSRSQ
jgi:hypothetical protein